MFTHPFSVVPPSLKNIVYFFQPNNYFGDFPGQWVRWIWFWFWKFLFRIRFSGMVDLNEKFDFKLQFRSRQVWLQTFQSQFWTWGWRSQGVCSRILYCKVHDYLKSKSNNSSLKWMKIADSKYRGHLAWCSLDWEWRCCRLWLFVNYSYHQNKNFTCKARRDNPPPYNINFKSKFHGF